MPRNTRRKARSTKGPSIRWTGLRPLMDASGKEFKRFYQLESLSSATDFYIREKDRFIAKTMKSVLGPGELQSLGFDLRRESPCQLIFRVQAANVHGKRATFGFVAAKNDRECTVATSAEHLQLQGLYGLAPQHIVKTFEGNTIFLPGRRKQGKDGRDVYAYLTEWMSGFAPLSANRNQQFMALGKDTHTFTKAETDEIRGLLVEVVARTFDMETRASLGLRPIAAADFMVRKTKAGKLMVKLATCRGLQQRMTPARLIDTIMKTTWDWDGHRVSLMPEAPETFYRALVTARGAVEARRWVTEYLARRTSGNLPNRDPAYTEALRALVAQ